MSVVDCLCVRLNSLDHDGDVKSLATTSLMEIFFFFFFFNLHLPGREPGV